MVQRRMLVVQEIAVILALTDCLVTEVLLVVPDSPELRDLLDLKERLDSLELAASLEVLDL